MSKQETVKLEWSRWIVIGGTGSGDVSPSEYDGPVLVQLEGGSLTLEGSLAGGLFLVAGEVQERVVRWKPAPVEMTVAR